MTLVSVVRAEFLRTRNFDYVLAARSLGVSNLTIMRRHVLPNAAVAALTFLPFILCGAVTTLTAHDFLGFGLPAGSPSLGELLQQGKANLHAPWLGLTGFFTLRPDAVPADLYRRSGARRPRPKARGPGTVRIHTVNRWLSGGRPRRAQTPPQRFIQRGSVPDPGSCRRARTSTSSSWSSTSSMALVMGGLADSRSNAVANIRPNAIGRDTNTGRRPRTAPARRINSRRVTRSRPANSMSSGASETVSKARMASTTSPAYTGCSKLPRPYGEATMDRTHAGVVPRKRSHPRPTPWERATPGSPRVPTA